MISIRASGIDHQTNPLFMTPWYLPSGSRALLFTKVIGCIVRYQWSILGTLVHSEEELRSLRGVLKATVSIKCIIQLVFLLWHATYRVSWVEFTTKPCHHGVTTLQCWSWFHQDLKDDITRKGIHDMPSSYRLIKYAWAFQFTQWPSFNSIIYEYVWQGYSHSCIA